MAALRSTSSVVRILAIIAVVLTQSFIGNEPTAAEETTPKSSPRLPDIFHQAGRNAGEVRIPEPKVSGSISPKTVKNGDVVTLSVTLELPPKAHVAPQKSKSEFGLPTRIRTKSLTGLKEIDAEFTADKKPKTRKDPKTGKTEIYFEGTITWSKKLRVVDAATLKAVSADISLRYQICTDGLCKPPKPTAVTAMASVESPLKAETATPNANTGQPAATRFPLEKQVRLLRSGKPDPIAFQFKLSPKGAQAGAEVTLSITATLEDGWHAFALTHKKGGIGLPVEIEMFKLRGLIPAGNGWRPDHAPKVHVGEGGRLIEEHYGTVVWKRTFKVQPGTTTSGYGVAGRVSYQICQANRCLPTKRVDFELGDLTEAAPAPRAANKIDDSPFPVEVSERTTLDSANLGWYLLLAFAGGFILNVMPCVLPVIAIKVMSFVQQAGEDRGRVFVLNTVYAAGVITVFLLLATLSVFLGYGWGGLFQRAEFTLIMGVIVFAMGLSLLGIFEIPLPGFFGSAAGKQHSEGPAGAFLTGVFATILATPCSGPFLGVTLAWSVRQPPEITYLVWGTMGLGMAFPYLVFALFPKATKLLPRPGNWMVRFKEISGFVLMGTTVWIVQSLKKPELFYTLILLASSAFSLWMVGKLYMPTTPRPQKWLIRLLAFSIVLFAAFAGAHVLEHVKPDGSAMFRFLQRWDMLSLATVLLGTSLAAVPFRAAMSAATTGRRWLLHGFSTACVLMAAFGAYFAQTFAELPWKPYSEKALHESIQKGDIVLIDFTADWCATCKTVERFALNRRSTLQLVEDHGIITLRADITTASDETNRALRRYESESIPLLVIIPAATPNDPIILRDVYTRETLQEKLREAVARNKAAPKPARSAQTRQASLR